MKKLKNLIELIKYNGKTLVVFELVYKLLSVTIFIPLVLFLFDQSIKLSGFSYITPDNLLAYITSPVVIIFVIIILLLLTFFSFIDASAIIYILDGASERKKVSLGSALKFSLKNSLRALHLKNILIVVFILFMIPLINIGISSSLLQTIRIPDYVVSYILANDWLVTVAVFLFFIISFLDISWLYSFHYFTLEGCSFNEACRKSKRLHYKYYFRDLLTLVILQIILLILFFILFGVIVGLVFFIVKSLSINSLISVVVMGCAIVILSLLVIIFLSLSTPINYASITVLFYRHKLRINEEVKHIYKPYYEVKPKRIYKVITVTLMLGSIAVLSTIMYLFVNKKIDFDIEYTRLTTITAHRGSSINYPENSMSSFEAAVKEGADIVEFDVQLTKDKVPIIMHDGNLLRTTGYNKKVKNAKYEDIKDLDIGVLFDEKFKGERIPLFDEVLDYFKTQDVMLNIEAKPKDNNEDLAHAIVDRFVTYDLYDKAMVTSGNYDILVRIKELDSNIKTAFIVGFALGDLTEMREVDGFSVETSFITREMVIDIHKNNQEIYAWTINDDYLLNKMINYNVDSIITDDVEMAKNVLENSRKSNWLYNYVTSILEWF